MARKYLTQAELLDELENFEDSDDSIRDPDYMDSSADESDSDDVSDDRIELTDDNNVSHSTFPVEPASLIWSHNFQAISGVLFTGNEGIQGQLLQNNEVTPVDIFFTIIDANVLELMVTETNRYASQVLGSNIRTRGHRMTRWKNTDMDEMKKFLGVILFMGIVNFPKIECYWKLDNLYYHPIMHKIKMSYNRFSLLLRCWHFVDNSLPRDGNDRLYKVSPLVDAVVANIQKVYTPGKTVAIDESMILFRGRLQFRQYNPGKTNKYGIKIYKLCTPNGFVWNFKIYCGNDPTIETLDKPGSVVVTLGEKLLNEGRLFITDNWYTSIPLAIYLKNRNTDLCGTLRKNKKFLPKDVVNAKLKRGESFAMQANNITVLKWCDKRDVLMLSTCQGNGMTQAATRRDPEKTKPNIILEYNKGKQGIDISDQMSSYYSCLRKSLIWYKKVAIELIAGSVIVNSWLIFNELCPGKNIRQLEFVEQLLHQIFQFENKTTDSQPGTSNNHFFTGNS
ncbi:hypothetical protein NQ314_015025 [Rhamnusium bicolor]|uniref:PiggyBac transposable element-derived protein domain-containing protein n=1 Tax=Rhamnusium bicolor TaxID=1586634 RepID=A0AAV8X0F6_9CUCU|nr:hypothetical protein NQ314_015025 [Rhamnusium bicolor]